MQDDMDRLVKERGEGYGKRKNGDKNAFNLKTIVGSACDTDVAAAPNLLLPLSHFYPPLKCRALSVPSVLAKPGNRLPRKCYKYYRRQTYSSDAWSVIMLQHLQFPLALVHSLLTILVAQVHPVNRSFRLYRLSLLSVGASQRLRLGNAENVTQVSNNVLVN